MNNECTEYCFNFGCQQATNCPARTHRIERVAKVGLKKKSWAITKYLLRFLAFSLLSLFFVLMMCAAVVMILEGSKP